MRWRALTFVSLLLATPSCARCGGGDSAAGAGASASGSSSSSAGGAGECVAIGPTQRFAVGEVQEGAGPVPFAAELGSAAADDAGWLVGVRSPGALGDAKVLRVSSDGGSMHVVASWLPAAGAARAARVSARAGAAPVVVLTAAEGDHRTVKLARLLEGKLVELATLPAEADESEAIATLPTRDGVLVAWDDSDEAGSNGHVRLRAVVPSAAASAPASASASASAPVPAPTAPSAPAAASAAAARPKKSEAARPADAVSPVTTDASFPVLVPVSDGRAVLLWLAERPEATESPDGGAGEPSQQESYRWIEGVVVDVARAQPIGAPMALTPRDGHTQTFSAQLVGDAIEVAVRDDARPTDGDGGSIYVVSAALPPASASAGALGAPRVLTRVSEGVSAGLPTLLLGARPWLFWLGPDDDARLVPAAVMPSPATTRAPSLDGRRIVAQANGLLLTSRLLGAGIELSLRRCTLR